MATQILAKDLFATAIHPLTKKEIEEGELPAGTQVRRIKQSEEMVAGEVKTLTCFDASTDGGKSWFPHKTYGVLTLSYGSLVVV